MTNLVARAKVYAEKAHEGQKRKFSDRPYTYHLDRVYSNLLMFGESDEDVLAAAWLHDTLEDTSVNYGDLVLNFDTIIADLVVEVSHPLVSGYLNRSKRWPIYLTHFANASINGQKLKLVDRISNLTEFYEQWGELPRSERKFVKEIYLAESIDLLGKLNAEILVQSALSLIIERLLWED